MAKFYDGQSIVCVRSADEWGPTYPGSTIPTKGKRYTAGKTMEPGSPIGQHWIHDGMARVQIREYDTYWNENGFAPVTDEQVRDVIREANKAPGPDAMVDWLDSEIQHELQKLLEDV